MHATMDYKQAKQKKKKIAVGTLVSQKQCTRFIISYIGEFQQLPPERNSTNSSANRTQNQLVLQQRVTTTLFLLCQIHPLYQTYSVISSAFTSLSQLHIVSAVHSDNYTMPCIVKANPTQGTLSKLQWFLRCTQRKASLPIKAMETLPIQFL